MPWRRLLGFLLHDADEHLETVLRRLKARFGFPDALQVLPYRGNGTGSALYLQGRVIEHSGLAPAGEHDAAVTNLLNMYRRFDTDEIAGARVRARLGGLEAEAVTDREGYFSFSLVPPAALPTDRVWHSVELELLAPTRPGQELVRATGEVLVPREAEFAVVSDIDDTVLRTGVTDLLGMARVVLLGNARTRLPFEGVAAFYRSLERGPDGHGFNPVFYVSSSPWNLYDLITDFLELNGIPTGPVFLRDWGRGMTSGLEHKLGRIRSLLATYPDLPFVLVGDSGEKDPEIYRTLALEQPGRIKAIYIRHVTDDRRAAGVEAIAAELSALGVPMLLARDTVAAAAHALGLGLVAPEAEPAVARDKARDEAAPTAAEQLLAAAPPQGSGSEPPPA